MSSSSSSFSLEDDDSSFLFFELFFEDFDFDAETVVRVADPAAEMLPLKWTFARCRFMSELMRNIWLQMSQA